MQSVDNPKSAARNLQWGDSCAVILIALGMVVAGAAWQSFPGLSVALPKADPSLIDGRSDSQSAIHPPQAAMSRIDPNVAPWWELTLLPRVGETRARAIVEFREASQNSEEEDILPASAVAKLPFAGRRSPVFAQPGDLQAVHGIGPKTVRRMAPYLRIADD